MVLYVSQRIELTKVPYLGLEFRKPVFKMFSHFYTKIYELML